MKCHNLTFCLLASIALSGCISDPKYVEEDFGKSVTQMINAQIYDPKAASQPDELPPLLVDGEVATIGVDGYRESTKRKDSKPSNVSITLE